MGKDREVQGGAPESEKHPGPKESGAGQGPAPQS
jgi:hypothetical protein